MTLAARDLSFGFRQRTIGRGVALSLPAGSVTCLLGPNGSGKTTLLRTLLGFLAPHGGELELEGRALQQWSARERATRLAYVPQAAESYFDFSVGEMVEIGRTAHLGVFSRPSRQDREVASAALSRLGLAHLADRPIHRVSGGERQLALVARALATEAKTILMDEPTANLDYANQALVLEEIVRLRGAGHAVLFSTHHPEHALRIADRVLMLRDGAVLASGAADEVLDTGRLSALYARRVEVVDVRMEDGSSRRTCV